MEFPKKKDWQAAVLIKEADLERFAKDIQRKRQAYEITDLARIVVRHRLLHGPEPNSRSVEITKENTTSVQWWDQVSEVTKGDHLFFLKAVGKRVKAYSGEVTNIKGDKISVFLPDFQKTIIYKQYPRGTVDWNNIARAYKEQRELQRERAAEKRFDKEYTEVIDLVIFEYGDQIMQSILYSLKKDDRFIRLSGRWFLKELVVKLNEAQVAQLAWSLIQQSEPQSTEALAREICRNKVNDAMLFGVYSTLRQHTELFQNVNPGPQPRWKLIAPPPGPFTPQHSVYDPETYEVVARVGEEADQRVVNRLWELELLEAVI